MRIFSRIKQEAGDLSRWFKISVIIIFVIYILFWFFTIHINNFQNDTGIKPFLPVMAQDSEGYYNLSESLINGDRFSQNGKTETLRAPGYPLFVAVLKTIGRSYFAVTLVQILMVFLSAFIIRRIGILFVSKKVGEIAAFLFLINPVTLVLSLAILTDTLFLFLFTLSFYLILSLSNERPFYKVFWVSLVFAFAVYTRLGMFAIPVIVTPVLTFNVNFKYKLKFIGTLLVLLAVFVSPWIIRNYVEVGVAGFTSFRSQNLGWAATKFLSSKNNTSQSDEYYKFIERINIESSDYYDIRYSDKIGKEAKRIIFEKPFSYLKYHIVSSLPFLFPSTISFALDTYNSAIHKQSASQEGAIGALSAGKWREFWEGIMKSWWKVLERLCWLAAYALSLFGIWEYRKKVLVWILVFTIGYLMLLAGPASGPRYAFQAFPFMFLLFSLGGVCLYRKLFR